MKIDEMIEKLDVLLKTDPKLVQNDIFASVLETTKRQIEKCAIYRQICKQKNFDPRRDLKSTENFKDIPFVTSSNFKKKKGQPKQFLCVPESDIRLWCMSTGTSGDPSMTGRDYINLVRYVKMVQFIFNHVLDVANLKSIIQFFPKLGAHHTLEETTPYEMNFGAWGYDVAVPIPAEKRVFALRAATAEEQKATGKPFLPDMPVILDFLKKKAASKEPTYINGSAPLLFGILTQINAQTGATFDLSEDSFLTCGGGWKTYAGQEVSRETFYATMKKILNIPAKNIRDTYCFSEMDLMFAECEHHNKHVPPICDVIVRDFDSLKPVALGEKGLINIINPLAHSYAGVSVLQDDVVRIVMEDGCPCGRRGKVIESLGRAKGAEARGCGAQVAADTKV